MKTIHNHQIENISFLFFVILTDIFHTIHLQKILKGTKKFLWLGYVGSDAFSLNAKEYKKWDGMLMESSTLVWKNKDRKIEIVIYAAKVWLLHFLRTINKVFDYSFQRTILVSLTLLQ